jgi:aminoglycoside phosphotransferase (APT) family kinase protein
LNAFEHYRVPLGPESLRVQVLIERGSGANPPPIVLTHGWPGSIIELIELIATSFLRADAIHNNFARFAMNANATSDDKRLGLPTKQQTRNLEGMRAILQPWLQGHIDGIEQLQINSIQLPKGAGLANETVMLEAQWERNGETQSGGYVVRIETPDPLFPGTTAERQYRMYAALADAPGVPVPRVLGFEENRSLLGAPFFVMEKIEGRVPADDPPFHHTGWVTELSTAERDRMWRDAIRAMAALHAVDADKFAFLNPTGVKDGLRATLDYYIDEFDRPVNEAHPILDTAREWLLRNYPGNYGLELAWGDARVANMIFEEGRCRAVLDWDMVSLAGPETDLAWWCITAQTNTHSMGIKPLPGFGTAREMLALWQQHTGREARDFEWHLVYAAYRLGIIMRRLARLLKKNNLLPPGSESIENNSNGVQYLTTLLNLTPIAPVTMPWLGLDA